MWPIHEVKVKLKTKHVNNKRIFSIIDDFIMYHLGSGIFRQDFEREQFAEDLEDIITQIDSGTAISQCRVRFVAAPPPTDGPRIPHHYHILTAEFKQVRCENITSLEYAISVF